VNRFNLGLLVVLLGGAGLSRSDAAPGDLDPLNVPILGHSGGTVLATAVQIDGKTLLVGRFVSVLGVPRQNIARLNADGTLDLTFDPKPNGEIESVAVQTNGRILISGSFTSFLSATPPNPTYRSYVARLYSSGSLDPTFNPSPNGRVRSVVEQADGKILLTGDFTTLQPRLFGNPVVDPATERRYVARVNADGALDAVFDPKANNAVYNCAVQRDGGVVLVGAFTSLQPNGALSAAARHYVARVHEDGTLDADFDPKANQAVSNLAIQADRKVLLGGGFTSLQPNGAMSATERLFVARVNADGTLDAGFDPKANQVIHSMAVQANGKIVLGGSFTTLQPNGAESPTGRQFVARVNADGTLDAVFDPRASSQVRSVTLQRDGKILLGGQFSSFQPNGAGSSIIRLSFARLDNEAITQTMVLMNPTLVRWLRGGSSPELSDVLFQHRNLNGTPWTPLGGGVRIGTTSHWQFTSESLPSSGQILARGRTAGGSGGSSQLEAYLRYNLPDILVSGNGVGIVNGDSTPVETDHTAFGAVGLLNKQATRVFTVFNNGTAPLSLTGAPRVEIVGEHAAEFTLTTQPAATVAVGQSTSFAVTFDPRMPGLRTALVRIANSDPDRSVFNFAVSGFGGFEGVTRLLPQRIAFAAPGTLYYGQGPVALLVEASSGLPVTLELVSGPGTLEGSVLTLPSPFGQQAGTTIVRATQAGDGRFAPAKLVTREIKVERNASTLRLTGLNQRYDGTAKEVGTFSSLGPAVVSYRVGGVFGPTAPTAAGRYAVRAVAGGSTTTGTLVIAKAPLYVVPQDLRKFVGEGNPALALGYEGFVGGDTEVVLTRVASLGTTAKTTSPGGLYPITATGGAAANYALIYKQGTLVVESFAAGYEALLVDGSDVPNGKLSLTVARSGRSFSGSVALAGETTALRVSGPLVTNQVTELATGVATVVRSGALYALDFSLQMNGVATGEVKREGLGLASFEEGRRLLVLPRGAKVGYSGAHTAVLESAQPAGAGVPAGAGWARVAINAQGALALVGRLGDGTAFTTRLLPDAGTERSYRLWVQPYKPARVESFLGGTFAVSMHPALSRGFVADGTSLYWAKAERAADRSYPLGFVPVAVGFKLDPWVTPTTATPLATLLGLTGESFTVQHSATGSASEGDLPAAVTLSPRNAMSVPGGSNPTKWSTKLNLANGTFTGCFELLDAGVRRVVPFSGVLRQPTQASDPVVGDGHFALPPLAGAVPATLQTGEVLLLR
jgi:uncharacterized delta-60 repeat protein